MHSVNMYTHYLQLNMALCWYTLIMCAIIFSYLENARVNQFYLGMYNLYLYVVHFIFFFSFEAGQGLTLIPGLVLHACHQPILPVAGTTGTSVHHHTQLKF
jgi:fucose 4-O-acetylase-like acetyltransferase